MANPLSKELREKIVAAYERGVGTIAAVANIFDVSSRSVARFLQIKRERGDLAPLPLPGRPPILTEVNLSIIKKIILSNKDGTLSQHCDDFYNTTGILVTITTMHNACEILNLNLKKKFLRTRARQKRCKNKTYGFH